MNVKEAASLPMRQVAAGYLKEQMAQDDKVIVINADLGGACGTAGLAKDFPDRTLNVGIAEANMVGVAAGLASYGYKPFIFTFAPFATRRVADQLAISVSYAGLKVVVVGTDPGVSAQMNGGTHMGVEDTAIMRAIPGFLVYEPSDCGQYLEALPQIMAHDGPVYIRQLRKLAPPVYPRLNGEFKLGKADLLREGTDVTLIASGVEIEQAMGAADALAAEGVEAAVIDPYTVKPLDVELIRAWAAKTGAVVTAENHNKIGGLYSAVTECLSQKLPTPVHYVAVEDEYGEVGPVDYLAERFGLTDKQTTAILEMRLRRLTGLEREKIQSELEELREKIAYYNRVLSDPQLVRDIIKEELQEIKKKFDTPRRTQLSDAAKDLDVEDLIAEESMVVTVTKAGYVKRLPVATYRQQKRGGKGMQAVNLKDNDYVEHLFVASTHSFMLFFSTKGKVYRLKVYELPEASRHARGTAIVNLLPLEKGETISAVIATKDFPTDEYLMFATEHGMVKKTSMEQYDRTRRDGLIAINLKDGDRLISVRRVAQGENVIMVSSAGKAIMWPEDEVRAMGRGTMGVRGMNAPADAKVLGMEIARPETDLFVITEKGYGKRTPISEYPSHHRGGQGVFTITMTEKKGLLAAMKIVGADDEIMIMSEEGVVVRTPVEGISELGRSTQGVRVMNVAEDDRVTAVAIAAHGKKKCAANADGAEELDESSIDEMEE